MTERTTEQREEWRELADHPGYLVSSYGRVRTPKGKLIGKPNHVRGYVRVSLPRGDVRLVHQLVLETFVGPRPTPKTHSRHLNGLHSDNRLSNLRWGTAKQNAGDRKFGAQLPDRTRRAA